MNSPVTSQAPVGLPSPSRRPSSLPGPAGARTVQAAFAFGLAALNLRIAVASLSPVLTEVQRDEHLSSFGGGALSTVPVVCFGAFAFLAPRLTRRFGPHRLLWCALLALAGGIVLRSVPGVLALFGGTLIAGAAIAVGNVLMPQLIKHDFAGRAGLMLGCYSLALSGGAALAAGVVVPLESATGWGWRQVLALGAVPALVAALARLPELLAPDRRSPDRRRDRAERAGTDPAAPALRALWRDRTAWAVTLYMGLQSLGYYAILSWLPTLLQDHGMSDSQAGWMLSFSSFPGMAASFAAPWLQQRPRPAFVAPLASGLLCATGFVGLFTSPVSGAYVWMTALGLGQGLAIGLALGYIVARSPDAHHTGQLSTMAQGAGYLIACLGPLGLGLLHSMSGGWSLPVAVLLAVLVAQTAAAFGASRDRHVLAS
ncbi:MFS transporter, CP family, cyanate transporter [Streptomyces sp. TverLS-915]|uniref:MFS transporter n=1 Tax=Streptomyces sp. TverLS-915 TaxID=1839763 RepID=UPI00081D3AF4|nr:MFS transporter [Streptomyces sp. TverLS-915]SCD73801.1 MFS transporter, CP family, cyanate transporter [Streptomyces sp. TverLS-915]